MMNELLNLFQNAGQSAPSPFGMMGISNIRFRDILQLLLLSLAARIVTRAYDVLNRLGYMPALPMQNPQSANPMLLQFPQPPTPNGKES